MQQLLHPRVQTRFNFYMFQVISQDSAFHHPDINAAALDTRFTPFNAFGVGGDKRHLRPLVAVVVKQYPCADEHSHNRKDPDR